MGHRPLRVAKVQIRFGLVQGPTYKRFLSRLLKNQRHLAESRFDLKTILVQRLFKNK